ncbi:LOW QUALITY PROTEIN: TPT domain-containing protein, partial [Cephalotus follicularis]
INKSLLILNCTLLAVGNVGGPLIMRLYFLKGGKEVWISSCLETAGWPFNIFPILVSYWYRRRKEGPGTKLFSITPRLFAACAVVGILTGLDDFFLAFLYVNSIAVVSGLVRTVKSVRTVCHVVDSWLNRSLRAVRAGSECSKRLNRTGPDCEDRRQRLWYTSTPKAATHKRILKLKWTLTHKTNEVDSNDISVNVIHTRQLFLVLNLLQAIPREARKFELGQTEYYVVLVCSAIFWQFFFLGAVGVIFCASSLLSGIIIAALLPVTETLAVLFYHEKFHVKKVIFILFLWGSVSFFYGELQQNKKNK